MRIYSNPSSLSARKDLKSSESAVGKAIERLNSGLRINSAKDDAAALGVANRMTSKIRGTNVAERNTRDAMSMVQTALGSLDEVNASLLRVRELAIQAANGTLTTADRNYIQLEVKERLTEVSRTLNDASFNGIKLLTGGQDLQLQIGAGASANDQLTLDVPNLSLISMGLVEYNVNEAGVLQVGPPLTHMTYNYPFPGGGDFTLDLWNENGTIFHEAVGGGNFVDTPGVPGEHFKSSGFRWANYGVDMIAQRFGLQPSDLSFHQVLHPDDVFDGSGNLIHAKGDPVDDVYVVRANGDYYRVETGYHRRQKKDGPTLNEAIFGITLREYQHPVTVKTVTVNPNDLSGSLIDPESFALDIQYKDATVEETSFLRLGIFQREDGTFFHDTYVMIDGNPYRHQIDIDNMPVELVQYVMPDGNPVQGVDNSGIDGTLIRSNVEALDRAIAKIDEQRSYLGAVYNRLESSYNVLTQGGIDLQAARSRIEDADYALEVSNMTKNQILQNASQSVLAQANQMPKGIVSLLQL